MRSTGHAANAVSYVIVPAAAVDSCRLLVKLVVRFRPGVRDRLAGTLAPWLDWWMMRRQLLNLKVLAEGTFRDGAVERLPARGCDYGMGRS
jgi:hypothetical protein